MIFQDYVYNLARNHDHLHDVLASDIFCSLFHSAHFSFHGSLVHALRKVDGETGLSVERHCIGGIVLDGVCFNIFRERCERDALFVPEEGPEFLGDVRGERREKDGHRLEDGTLAALQVGKLLADELVEGLEFGRSCSLLGNGEFLSIEE